ncbi:MAG: hypothetical protein SGCHY_000465 [Lobulomycetales sp.]
MARTKRSSSLDSQRDLLTVHDGGSKLLVARLRLQNETLLPVDSLQSLDGFNSEGADNSTPEKNSPRSSVFSSSEEDGDNQPVVSDSLWEHFLAEFDWRQPRETFMYKNERVRNFLAVPLQMEKFITLGYFICIDTCLSLFTILPLRFIIAMRNIMFRHKAIRPDHIIDVIKTLLIAICVYLTRSIDSSIIYHSIRGQSVLKLYVIFNVLEICDKLCTAFGHDILDSLYSQAITFNSTDRKSLIPTSQHLGWITHFSYLYIHVLVLFYHMITLNVAINSYSNSLLTLMMSNQFVEIKGSVFKRFEKENLFQIACSDVMERFQLVIYVSLITLRNYIELTGGKDINRIINFMDSLTYTSSIKPLLLQIWALDYAALFGNITPSAYSPNDLLVFVSNFASQMGESLSNIDFQFIFTLLGPAVIVIGVEVLVDSLKHAFITKFNQIKVCSI